jgi:type VI secretion system ImpC/EvpB family protein
MSLITSGGVMDLTLGASARPATSGKLAGFALLEATVRATAATQADTQLEQFLREPSPWRALALWLGQTDSGRLRLTRQHVARLLSRDIARIDELLTRQVNAILHDPAFQKLEASWRGLRYLVEQVPEGENIKVRVLNVSWKELTRDQERALEFDQSQLFRKVYGEEFGTPGGEPFGVLLGDYEVRHRPGPDNPTDDVGTLLALSSVAAAAFAPFLAAVHPSLLDLESFTELERPLNLSRTFEPLEYLKWRAFRHVEDARFIGLVLPRVLMRLPYQDGDGRVDGFRFREEVADPDRRQYLWGNAVYPFGGVLVRAFSSCGWLADIRGVPSDSPGGGVVTGLPVHPFSTDPTGVAPKCSTDVMITDVQEKELAELGFIPLCHCPDTEVAAFYGSPSVQRVKKYDEAAATANARLSAMLPYVLCVSRFAHYLKVIARDRIGAFVGPDECEEYLRRWVNNYVVANEEAGPETKARYPLREARVEIREHPGKPGSYLCVFHLRPHFQLDQVDTALSLWTELAAGNPR